MRRSSKLGHAALVGSILLAQGSSALAQRPGSSSAGDAPVVPRTSAILGQNGGGDASRESGMLVAHGLEMIIEGSTLQGLALRASGVGLGPAVDPRPSPAGVVGSSSVGIGATSPATPATPRGPVPASTAGTGFTGSAGETVSGRPVGTAGDAGPRIGATQPTPVSPAVTLGPLNAGQSVEMLQRHALMSFEAGDRLLGMSKSSNGPDSKFAEAAARYAATLKALASQPSGSAPNARGPVEAVGADLASVALINHAVKEALGSMKIHQAVRQMGGTSGPAGQQLMDHAQQMDAEARSAIRPFLGADATSAGMIQTLAQQADELIRAIQTTPAEPR